MNATTLDTIVGVFDHQEQAVKAIDALKGAGFRSERIGVASRQWSQRFENVSSDDQKTASDGAVWGSVAGGGVGAALGLIGSVLLPGAIPIIAGSMLVNTLIGAAAGAAGGALGGPFIAMGFSEAHAAQYGKEVEAGKTVVLVQAPGDEDKAKKILVAQGAYDDSMA